MKSEDRLRSSVFSTAAHHGATLAIDAINVDGTTNRRVYERMGKIFSEEAPYENGFVTYEVPNLKIFDMKKIVMK